MYNVCIHVPDHVSILIMYIHAFMTHSMSDKKLKENMSYVPTVITFLMVLCEGRVTAMKQTGGFEAGYTVQYNAQTSSVLHCPHNTVHCTEMHRTVLHLQSTALFCIYQCYVRG